MHNAFMRKAGSTKTLAIVAVIALIFGLLTVQVLGRTGAQAAEQCSGGQTKLPDTVVTDVALTLNGAELKNGSTLTNEDRLSFGVGFTVPGELKAGDYFTYQAPANDVLTYGQTAISNFPIYAQGTNQVIGCGSLDSSGLLTVVFNDGLAGQTNVSGTATVEALVTVATSKNDTEFDVIATGTKRVTVKLSAGNGPPPAGQSFYKDGWQTLPEGNQYYNVGTALTWRIVTPSADGRDYKNVVVQDNGPTSESNPWRFNADYITANGLKYRVYTAANANGRAYSDGSWADYTGNTKSNNGTLNASVDVTETSLKISIPVLKQGQFVVFDPIVATPVLLDSAGNKTGEGWINGDYVNTAVFSAEDVAPQNSRNATFNKSGAGQAAGTTTAKPATPVVPTTTVPTTPVPTTTVSTTPVPTTTVPTTPVVPTTTVSTTPVPTTTVPTTPVPTTTVPTTPVAPTTTVPNITVPNTTVVPTTTEPITPLVPGTSTPAKSTTPNTSHAQTPPISGERSAQPTHPSKSRGILANTGANVGIVALVAMLFAIAGAVLIIARRKNT